MEQKSNSEGSLPVAYQWTSIDSLNKESRCLRYTDLKASLENAEKALNLAMHHQYLKGQAYANLNLMAGHFLRSENKDALELGREAMEYFNSHTLEPGYVDTHTYIGNIYESFGDYETALEHCQKAYRVAKKIDYALGIGEVQSVLGLIYSRLSDHDRALKAFEEGLRIREEQGDQLAVASSLNRIARTYTLKKQYEKALIYYKKSLRIREKLDQIEVVSWTYLGLASTYEDMSALNDAKGYYQKILGDAEDHLDNRCKLQAMLGMGRTLCKMKQEKEALTYFEDSRALAEQLEAKPLLVEAHHALADYFESIGDFEKALIHYKLYRRIHEDVLNDDTRIRLKNQQITFAIEKSEKEKEIYQLRNVELKSAYDEITESIDYASRIQIAMLPHHEILTRFFPEHFVLFLPKNIVSGDFYWSAKIGSKIVFAVADCTGHGVPGALMSMLGISFMNEIVVERGHTNPGEILDILRREVICALKQTGSEDEQHDGIDMALCSYDTKSGILEYAGAFNPLYLIRNGNLKLYKADRMPVCYYHGMEDPFRTISIQLKKGDQLYLFSDGYADQFGGPYRKKFKFKAFQEILVEYHQEKMEKQKELLHEQFLNWKGDVDQYDDVVLLGIRI